MMLEHLIAVFVAAAVAVAASAVNFGIARRAHEQCESEPSKQRCGNMKRWPVGLGHFLRPFG
jgi:hypothetical protein